MDWHAWLFVFDPKRFDVEGLFADGTDELDSLLLSTSWRQVKADDPFALYVGAPMTQGIYLIGHLAGEPEKMTGSARFFSSEDRKKKRWYVPIRIDKAFVKTPITVEQIDKAKTLANVSDRLRQRGSSPIGLTKPEWNLIDKWAKKRRGSRKLPKQ